MVPHLLADERLWLDRHDTEVFVAEEFAQHLPPFQRDGLRFLYAQYSKKNPGVILNDPSGYGKTVQCVLFVEAVSRITRPLPTLILCEADQVQHWRCHFQMWTNSANDKLDDGTNLFSNKEVFVYPVSSAVETSRREWSIVVLDSDVTLKSSALLKQLKSVKANFKIWITGHNLLNNLPNLSMVYEWLNPKRKFDAASYDKTGLSPSEQISKDIQLDIFCQNVLLRRTNENFRFNVEIQKQLMQDWIENKINREQYFSWKNNVIPANNLNSSLPNFIEQTKKKSKNKDATGLKIKRSKTDKVESNTIENMISDEIPKKEEKIYKELDNDENRANETCTKSERSNEIPQELEDNSSQIYSAMKKVEELTNKQFKGSFLDSIF